MPSARYWVNGNILGDPHSHDVPPLVACVASRGQVEVFPNTTCAAQHMAQLPSGYAQAARKAVALGRYLQRPQSSPHRCLTLPEAVSYARQALRKFGYTGWRITEPFGTRWKCYEDQIYSFALEIQAYPDPGVDPGFQDQTAGPAKVWNRVLNRPNAACKPGSRPENTAKVIARLPSALRRAGYGTWTITVGSQVSRAHPCYYESAGNALGWRHMNHRAEINSEHS